MRDWWSRLIQRLKMPRSTLVHVTGIQPLAPGVAVYAIDVDGRRIILGASTHAICVLDRYLAPNPKNRAGPSDSAA
jgi:flagellar biogenesis protein FliO